MILIVEGPSAVGKTTWCRSRAGKDFIPEAPEDVDAPDLAADPEGAARFWVAFNAERWRRARSCERKKGMAVCDTDPFHLYYGWAL